MCTRKRGPCAHCTRAVPGRGHCAVQAGVPEHEHRELPARGPAVRGLRCRAGRARSQHACLRANLRLAFRDLDQVRFLSELGVPDTVFQEMHERELERLLKLRKDAQGCLDVLGWYMASDQDTGDSLRNLCYKMVLAGLWGTVAADSHHAINEICTTPLTVVHGPETSAQAYPLLPRAPPRHSRLLGSSHPPREWKDGKV